LTTGTNPCKASFAEFGPYVMMGFFRRTASEFSRSLKDSKKSF